MLLLVYSGYNGLLIAQNDTKALWHRNNLACHYKQDNFGFESFHKKRFQGTNETFLDFPMKAVASENGYGIIML